MECERLTEEMLFNYETVGKTDYRGGEILPMTKTTYAEKPIPFRPPFVPTKDIQTMTNWKPGASVPFRLGAKRKEIIGTNPHDTQQRCEKQKDEEARIQSQVTRPRLVMTPAVSMDDMTDQRARKILVEDLYTTTVMKALQESASAFNTASCKAPFPGHPAPPNPITIPKLVPPYVSPEWRMDSASWDRSSLRTHVQPTKEFWLRRKPPICKACDTTAQLIAQKKMLRSMKDPWK